MEEQLHRLLESNRLLGFKPLVRAQYFGGKTILEAVVPDRSKGRFTKLIGLLSALELVNSPNTQILVMVDEVYLDDMRGFIIGSLLDFGVPHEKAWRRDLIVHKVCKGWIELKATEASIGFLCGVRYNNVRISGKTPEYLDTIKSSLITPGFGLLYNENK